MPHYLGDLGDKESLSEGEFLFWTQLECPVLETCTMVE